MKLEDQVASLELAKRLKELGVKQESLFYWVSYPKNYPPPTLQLGDTPYQGVWMEGVELFAAFTVAELGNMLPEWYPNGDVVDQMPHMTIGRYWRVNLDDEGMLCSEKTEAVARAKMLIYLIENGLYEPKK